MFLHPPLASVSHQMSKLLTGMCTKIFMHGEEIENLLCPKGIFSIESVGMPLSTYPILLNCVWWNCNSGWEVAICSHANTFEVEWRGILGFVENAVGIEVEVLALGARSWVLEVVVLVVALWWMDVECMMGMGSNSGSKLQRGSEPRCLLSGFG